MREKNRPAIESSEIKFSVPTGKLEEQNKNSIKVKGTVNKRNISEGFSRLVLKKAMELVDNLDLSQILPPESEPMKRTRKDTLPLDAMPEQVTGDYPVSLNLVNKKTGEIVTVKSGATIGAGQEADLMVPDNQFMSRIHAKFNIEGKAFLVKDLKSMNGTFLNGKKIEEFTVLVKPGDTVTFANEEFIVQ